VLRSASSAPRLVLVLARPGDALAARLGERLREVFAEVRVESVAGPRQLRERVEGHREELGALVVGAADSGVAGLVGDFERAMQWLRERTLVVVDAASKLDAVPEPLLESLSWVALDEVDVDDVVGLVADILGRPREVDVLASLVRSAVERRNLDSLPPLLGDWSSADALEPEHLQLADLGDGGRRANPLWAQWVSRHHDKAIARLGERLAAHRRRDHNGEGPLRSSKQPPLVKRKKGDS
jgi:hypothetical protein